MGLTEEQAQVATGWTRSGALFLLGFSTIFSVIIYRLWVHPLRHVPGPLLGRTTSLFLYAISYLGIEGRVLDYYHRVYNTKVLRISPNSVSISDPAAIHPIYVAGGGFPKDERYVNFNLGEVVTIFSSLDTEYRDIRAKAVAPLFSPGRLRAACEPHGAIHKCISEFIQQLAAFRADCKARHAKFDILDLCARLSLDVVTGYLLTEPYGGLVEHNHLPMHARQTTKLSINPFIFAIVAFSRFSLLPNWLFKILYALSSRLSFSEAVGRCFVSLNAFAQRLVEDAVRDDPGKRQDSYQARLLDAGIAPAEVQVQCQAIVFASSDSTAVKLATILFHLVRNQDKLRRARAELVAEGDLDKPADLLQLPYLRAVVKEGLRLGMANPTRMTRVVPGKGLRVGEVFLPPGTIVGITPYLVHHDPAVFPDPRSFRPERWLEAGLDMGLKRPNMERSLLMFGAGLRGCIGKNLAQQQLLETVKAVVQSGVLEGAQTCQERIELVEWFNAEIKGHTLEVEWL
ncbi:cytochrome P450 [Penicillium hispanicum]|uniref:cytochrome P450 n=1 Tax=Penicillium hispanicum TaxID=1080232 RepID=UPI00253F844A|nr:cytochrome P450 [Penicillium hispanicum]KAJ5578591.1 cytochrome P450 [Penicillium hispanicum]